MNFKRQCLAALMAGVQLIYIGTEALASGTISYLSALEHIFYTLAGYFFLFWHFKRIKKDFLAVNDENTLFNKE